jgi:putative transposase
MLITQSDTSPHVRVVVGGLCDAHAEMSRHTTFKFCLDPTVEQHELLARHAGASRFAFNECLGMVKTALTQRKTDPDTNVPWTGFDLINAFNAWKKTENAGRVFIVGTDGVAEAVVTGLAWRSEVCQQVFEEAAVDLGKGLKSWSDSRSGMRKGKKVGFPRFKKKTVAAPSFRLRNKHPKGRLPAIRVGDNNRPARSRCLASGRSACMTTPADCDACSPKAGPRSASPPSPTTPGTGGYR